MLSSSFCVPWRKPVHHSPSCVHFNTLINIKIILSSIRLIQPPKVLIGNAAILSFLSEEVILSLPIREVSLSSITVQMSVQVCPLEQSNQCAFTVMLNCTHFICLTLAFSRGQPLSVLYASALFENVSDVFISLVAQSVKNPSAMRETWVQSLGWKDPQGEGMATLSRIPAWRIPMDRGAWHEAVHGVTKRGTRLSD